jgi:hypothetical protein
MAILKKRPNGVDTKVVAFRIASEVADRVEEFGMEKLFNLGMSYEALLRRALSMAEIESEVDCNAEKTQASTAED